MSSCEELKKVFETLGSEVMKAYVERGVLPKEAKEDIARLLEYAKAVIGKAKCDVKLETLEKLIEEADEDQKELEETARTIKPST
jgi:hypothetical protein